LFVVAQLIFFALLSLSCSINTFRTEKKSAAQDKKTPQVMSKQKQLDKMVLLENPDLESTDKFSLRFPDPGPLRVPLIAEIKGLSFKYPKRDLAKETLDAEAEERRRIQRQQGTLQVASVTGKVQGVLDDAQPNLLEDVTCRVEITSRIGIIGANGCGVSATRRALDQGATRERGADVDVVVIVLLWLRNLP
jgi:ATPase subunit of ABC transporter with duplicated ATPase domains